MNRKPEVGTKMYAVKEHRYYVKDKPAPLLEYCVCEMEVTGFYKGGYVEICLTGISPEGYRTPYRYALSDIGLQVFYTVHDAARLALEMTEKYEQTWSWTGDPPMRRIWEHYLIDTRKCDMEGQISIFDLYN